MNGNLIGKKGLVQTSEGVFCPECHERLFPADLESFPRCPYCDHGFPADSQLEDFVLSPLIHRWMNYAHNQFPH